MATATEPIQSSIANPPNCWKLCKCDFLPGESFKNWNAYKLAVSQTCHRFKDRIISRSDDANELGDIQQQSKNAMKRCLNWWDLMWFGFGSVIGTGIFVLTGQETHDHAGPAIVLSYAISGFSAMLSVFCYTEFAVEIPVAGGSFAYLRIELGEFVAFIAAANTLLGGIVGGAAVARGWTSYFTTLLNREPNSLRIHTNLAKGFNLLDPIAVGVLIITSTLAIFSTRKTSMVNWIASAVNTVVIIFVIIAGFMHGKTSNMTPFLPLGVKGIFQAAAVIYFAYGGFDTIANLAEETRNPAVDIPIGLLGSMSCIIVIYCLMALSLSVMQPYTMIDRDAAYSIAFQSVGMKWAKPLVALGALKGMTTVMLIGSLGQARYLTHVARAHMIPPLFAFVHPKTGTPINATLLTTTLSASFAFFSSLDALSSILSISMLLIFMMMAVALIVRRYYARVDTSHQNLWTLTILLLIIIAASMGSAAYWSLNPQGWLGYTITVPCWFAATMAIAIRLPQQHTPKIWGVPFVPWLPSMSIAINIVLMGSLSAEAFIRFGVCTIILLIYYFVFGLHATYDMAHQKQAGTSEGTLSIEARTKSLTHSATLQSYRRGLSSILCLFCIWN